MSDNDCVPKDFQKNAISKHLSSVPGIKLSYQVKLLQHSIRTSCHLIGVFFSTDRNVDKFQNLLIQNFDFDTNHAAECAHALHEKFRHL